MEDTLSLLLDAIYRGDLAEVERLLDRGADPGARDKRDGRDETPLHLACRYGHADIARVLIERGATLEAKARWNRTPLHHACIYCNTHVGALLLDRGADVNVRDEYGDTPLHLVYMYNTHNNVNHIATCCLAHYSNHSFSRYCDHCITN